MRTSRSAASTFSSVSSRTPASFSRAAPKPRVRVSSIEPPGGARIAIGYHRRALRNDPREGAFVATEVEAQITGNVWKIEKQAGDSVVADEVILIIESMKMEIPVEAPCAGRIAEIRVNEGDSVEEGDVLVVLD
ncbi:MAG: biotin/lipoyl-binding protein [Deltaproteobacteria bacterium]|nr:biotin/lipoyl-binding protein [Deltaproteobacteria bacterium]